MTITKSWTREQQHAWDRQRWLKIKSDPVLLAAHYAKTKLQTAARQAKDPAWREKRKAYSKAYYAKTKTRALERSREWRTKNPGSRAAEHLTARYRLSRADYHRLAEEQQGCCAICGTQPNGKRQMGTLYVDHDHETGAVRGLLCQRCNSGLGHFRDRSDLLMKALQYLQRTARPDTA